MGTLLSLLVLALSAQAQEAALGVPRFEPDSVSFPVSVPAAFRPTTGYLVVYEDRDRPTGRTVRLPVAILHSRSGRDDLDPVLYLGGGPGAGALRVAQYPGAYPWTEDRSFVIFDQRGTGEAEPSLPCRGLPAARAEERRERAEEGTRQIAAVAACRDRLEARGVSASAYSTPASAADVEDLRRVLGVDRWALYGVSYGTRLALAVLREAPETVSAALLDSVLPPQADYDAEAARHVDAAIGLVVRDCAASGACAAAYPDLRARFDAALADAEADPLRVPAPTADGPVDLLLDGADLAGLVDTSTPWGIAATPRLLDGIARRDTAVVRPETEGLLGTSSSFAWGMRLSVWCSESLPFAERATGSDAVLEGLDLSVVLPSVCETWSVAPRPPDEVAPVVSDVPTLLVAGEMDPLTPPAWARLASETLSRSRVVEIRGGGHTPIQDWSGDGCAMRVAAAFLADPEAVVDPATPLSTCLAERGAPVFDLPPDE